MQFVERPLTRRALLERGAGAIAAAAVGGGAFGLSRLIDDGPRRLRSVAVYSRGTAAEFKSRPDLRPTTLKITGSPSGGAYYFLGPGAKSGAQPGPLIVDGHGEVVWFSPLPNYLWATDVKASSYRGEPVISWWQGTVFNPGYGKGE